MITEKTFHPFSGWLPLIVIVGLLIGGPITFGMGVNEEDPVLIIAGVAWQWSFQTFCRLAI